MLPWSETLGSATSGTASMNATAAADDFPLGQYAQMTSCPRGVNKHRLQLNIGGSC